MQSKDEILTGLNALAGEVAHAREQLLKGELVAVEQVNERIDVHCQDIAQLEPDDAIEIKPVLDALLLDLKTFADEIAYVQDKVKEILDAQGEGLAAGTKAPTEG